MASGNLERKPSSSKGTDQQADRTVDIERAKNLRLEYTQIMENWRHVLRSAIACIFVFLAICGLSVQVYLSTGSPAFKLTAVLCNIVLGALQCWIGVIVIYYFRSLEERTAAIQGEIQLSEDMTWTYSITVIRICLAGFFVIIVSWIVVLLFDMGAIPQCLQTPASGTP